MRIRRPSFSELAHALLGLFLLLGALEAPMTEIAAGENSLTHELSRLEDGGAAPIVDQARHPSQPPHFDSSHVRIHHCDVFCNAHSRNHIQPGHSTQLVVQVRELRRISLESRHANRSIGLESRAPRAPPVV